MRFVTLWVGLFLAVGAVAPQPVFAAGGDAAAVLRAGAAALGTVLHAGALHEEGTIEAAGQHGTFASWFDLANGYGVSHALLGPLSGDQGYDGASWSAANGITTVQDLPATQAQNVTTVYLALDSWTRRGLGIASSMPERARTAPRTARSSRSSRRAAFPPRCGSTRKRTRSYGPT